MNKIEGGPACDCFGGMDRCEGGRLVSNVMDYRPEWVGERCPLCRGTGVKPLSEWTDAQKAEWLKKYNPTGGVLTISLSEKGWGVTFDRWTLDGPDPIPNSNGDDAWGEAEDFSAALTAAIECVAKERECAVQNAKQ